MVRQLAERLAGAGVRVYHPAAHHRLRELGFFELLRNQGRTDLVDPVAFEVEYMVDRIQQAGP